MYILQDNRAMVLLTEYIHYKENRALSLSVFLIILFSFAFQTTMRSKHISYWCIMSRDHGGLEIYSLPDFQLVFSAMNFDNAPKVLIDTGNIPSQKMRLVHQYFSIKFVLIQQWCRLILHNSWISSESRRRKKTSHQVDFIPCDSAIF